jgi:fructose-1,6-bisphosphatase/inositol monophosphatase family enzyme
MNPAALHESMHALLREVSAKAILPYYRKLAAHEVTAKAAADDIVTVADQLAEDMLTQGLAKIADIPVVGEEAAHADPSVMDRLSGDCWIVDPIDGTSNFASGEGHFGILIAMARGGLAHTGWIYDPLRDRLLLAHRGKGAFHNGERITARSSGRNPPTLSAMKRYMSAGQRAVFEAEIAPHYELIQAPGCAAEQYPLTVFGEHDLAIYERTLPWDHAACCLFLNEAGGIAARPDGSVYRVDDGRKGMIGAANRALFDEFAERLIRAGYRPSEG